MAGSWIHSPLSQYQIFGNARAVGNTLMLPGPAGTEIRSLLLPNSQAFLSGLPADAVIEKAYLFWSGSLAQQGVSGPKVADPSVTFAVPNGQSSTVNGACTTVTHPTLGTTFPELFYCRAEVTSQVATGQLAGSYNGLYIVGDLAADPGHVDPVTGACTEQPQPWCQAKYAAWSLVVIYSAASETLQRDIHLYDGFRVIDHQDGPQGSLGLATIPISGFLADSSPQGTLSYFAVETDAQLGTPPQDLLPPPLGCTTCQDFVRFNGTPLQDSLGWPGNIFNESLGNGYGVDLDSIEVGSLLAPGATSATIQVGSGTGPVIDPAPFNGGGELFGFGWTLLTLRRPAPNFKTSATNKTVTPLTAGQGETVAYSVNVVNAGSAPATGTTLTDTLPALVDLTPGTLQLGGSPCTAAADGDPCTVSGKTLTVNLGTVSHLSGSNSRQLTFLATISGSATNGQAICNTAQVVSDQTPTPHSTAPACVTVQAPDLAVPKKVALDLDGGVTEPEDFIQYTVTLTRNSSGQVSGLTFSDDIPQHMQLLAVNGPPGSSVSFSTTGGAFGRGFVSVSNITIPANTASVSITFTARVDSASQLQADGVSVGSIDGLQICNQGDVTALFLPAPLSTDDPAVGGASDPTCLGLTYRPNLSTSAKSVVDLNGAPLEPGDTLRYTLRFTNTGNRSATVNAQDDLPPNVTGFSWIQQPAGASFTPGAGASGTGRITVSGLQVLPQSPGPPDESQELIFEVQVAASAPNGATVQNCASFSAAELPGPATSRCSAALEVYATADLSGSTKSVTDVNGGQVLPGDTLLYSISLTNSGNRSANGTTVSDPVPQNLTNVQPLDGGVLSGGNITWALGDLSPGASQLVRFQAQVVSPLPNGTGICNQASVVASGLTPQSTDDPSTPAAGDSTCVSVVSAPDLSALQKSVTDLNGGQVRPGDTLRYSITLTNSGNETATNVVLSDPVPQNLTSVQPLDGGTLAGGSISWAVGDLAPGEVRVLRFQAQVVTPLVNGTVISNQARVTATQVPAPGLPSDDPATPTPDDPTQVTVVSAANLSQVDKTVVDNNGGAPQPGDLLIYTISMVNSGDAPARSTVVTDVVDPNLTNITPLDGGVYDAATRTITWPALDVLPGPTRLRRFSARLVFPLAGGTQVCNQAQAQSSDLPGPVLSDDPATATASDPTCLTVVSQPDLSPSTKSVTDLNGGQVQPGDVLRYTITLINQGTQDATSVVLTDQVALTLTSVTPLDGGVYDAASRTLTWSVPQVTAQGQVQLRFDAQVVLPLDSGTQISNQASATSPDLPQPVLTDDPTTPATDDPTTVTVTSAPDLAGSVKSVVDVNGGQVEPGDTLAYSITVRNDGTSLARNVVLSDALDANLTFVSAGQGGSYDATSRTITWNTASTPALAQLGLGASAAVTLTFSATVASPLANGTQICNQGQAVSDEVLLPQLTDNPQTPAPGDPTCVTVSSAPDLAGTTKTVVDENGGQVRPGDTLTWNITVTNSGNSAATNLVVSDVVDSSLQQVLPGQGGLYDAVSRTITWSAASTPALASLPPGASLTLSFSSLVITPLQNGTQILNQATVQGPELPQTVLTDDPATPALDDPTRVTVVSAPNLETSEKTVLDQNGGDVEPGDTLTWTLTLKNTGDAVAQNVTVTDVVDSNLTAVTPLDGGSWNAATRTITWSVPSVGLSPGGDVALRFTSQVVSPLANGTQIANQGQLLLAGGPPVLTDDPQTPAPDDPTVVTVVSKPDLSGMLKTVSGALPGKKVGPGAQLTYSIVVPNSGTEDAQNVVVTDVVDTKLTGVTPLDGGSWDAASRTISWSVPLIPAGAQFTLRFTAAVRPDVQNNDSISNQAQATVAGQPGTTPSDDPDTPQPDDPTVLTVEAIANLTQFTKAVTDLNGGDVQPGDTLQYTLVLRNTGSAFAFNVQVADPVPAYLVNVQPGQGGALSGGNIVWDSSTTAQLAQLAPGAEVTLSFTAEVQVPTPNGTVILNQAVARADQLADEVSDDPSTPADNDPTRVTVVSLPRLDQTQKTVLDLNGGLVQPGDVLEYTIRVINSGMADTSGASLTDAIPAYTAYMPGSTRLNGATVADPVGAAPVSQGMSINSPGRPAGEVAVGEQNVATVRFLVRVLQETQAGRIISNQGFVRADGTGVEPTDDPATSADNDPTQLVVGQGPNLNNTIKVYAPQPMGDDGDGRFDPGEVIAYSVTIPNTGSSSATGVVFSDPLDPQGRGTYVAGSLQLNGTPLTDAPDGDAGAVQGNRIRVVVGQIAAGNAATITYQVRVASGPRVSNQGTVTSTELQPEHTDSDGNEGNGDSPTVVLVDGPASRRLSGSKTVLDVNGGDVRPGEELLYTINVTNEGSGEEGIDVVDSLPQGTSLVPGSLVGPTGATLRVSPPPAGQAGRGELQASFPLGPGQSTTLLFRVRLDQNLDLGSSVCNTARLGAGGGLDLQTELDPACVLLGSAVGTGGLQGVVFRDLGPDDGVRGEDDQLLSGFQVQAYAQGNPNASPLAAAVSDGEGRVQLASLPPGVYTLRMLSANGVQMGTLSAVTVGSGQITTRDLPVDPSGVVYNSVDGSPVGGARLTLVYDDTDPVAPGATVPTSLLGPGQQGQVTDPSGFYRFDVQRGRRYAIQLDPLTPALQFPSVLIPATDGFAQVGQDNEVVPDDLPDPKREGAKLTYYLRFDVDQDLQAVFNNHIPLDPLTSLIRLEKRVDRRRASLGDLATYSITVQNRSTRNFEAPGSRVVVEDLLPKGLRFLRNTTRLVRRVGAQKACAGGESQTRDMDGARVCLSRAEPRTVTGRLLHFGPFRLGAGESVRLVYQLAVGLDTRQGSYENRAVLRSESLSTTLSNQDEAQLLVEPDPDLDQGLVIGRVYCDNDHDGRPGAGDRGLAGARVYIDTGSYSVTDSAGKYHLRDIDPGLHLVKVDANTLPVGSRLTTDASRVVQLTRGLPAKIDFGVRCRENWVKVQQIKLKPKKKAKKPKQPKKKRLAVPGLSLAGDANALRLSAAGRPLTTLDVDLALTRARSGPPLPSRWSELSPPDLRRATDGRLRRGLVLHLKAMGRPVRGWRVAIQREDARGNLVTVRRFSGRDAPPAQLLWDGTALGKSQVQAEAVYQARLEVVGFKGSGGRSAARRFTVDRAGPPLAPAQAGAPAAFLDGTRLPLDAKGRFALTLGLPEKGAPLVELRAADGRATWVTLGRSLEASSQAGERIKVAGSLATPKLTVDGNPVDLSLLQLVLKAPAAALAPLDRDGALQKPLQLELPRPTALIRRWTVRIRAAADGALVHTLSGLGAPPAQLRWDGRDQGGKAVLRPGARYVARLSMEDHRGNRGSSPALLLRTPAAVSFSGLKIELPRLFELRRGVPVGNGRVRLFRTLRLLRRRPDSERYRMTVRLAPPARWPAARATALVRRVRTQLETLLRKQGIDPKRVELTLGALPPAAAPAAGNKKQRVRRLESLTLDAVPRAKPRAAAPAAARVLVDGEPLRLKQDGGFGSWVKMPPGAALVIDLRTASGARALLLVPTKASSAQQAVPSAAVRSLGAVRVASATERPRPTLSLSMRDGRTAKLLLAQAPAPGSQPAATHPSSQPQSAPAQAASQPAAASPAPPPATSTLAPLPRGGPPTASPAGPTHAGPSRAAGASAAFGSEELTQAFGAAAGRPQAKKAKAPAKKTQPPRAAQLSVDLPPRGALLRSPQLALRGKTHPDNEIRVNGKTVAVDPDGSFQKLVRLPDGKSELTVVATDKQGNQGTIRWPVQVADRALFLMAMAEGAIGQVGVELSGDTAHSRLDAGPVMLHGRTVLYLKGRIKGKVLFKNYFVTAHVDTAKQREFSEFFDQVVDPNRYYPVYGDASQHVRDVNARDKYYLLVKADRSSLRVGNFHAGLKGIELLRYDRVLYGAKVELDKRFFGGKLRQQARAHVSYDDARLTRDHNVLRATGGSIYYLRHGQVLEGSERVRLVVRERDTGLLLAELPKSRDADYVIDYAGGRLMFKAPVSSVADAGFSVTNPAFSVSTLAGHPVYVEVDYEYEAEGDGGSGSWGVQVKDTLFDVLTVGGTYVHESKSAQAGADYQLYGGELTLRHGKRSQLTMEVARSESASAHNFISEDGGITYLDLNHVAMLSADGRARDANAYKVALTAELSDFVKSARPGLLTAQGYFARQDRGFFSGGTILEQGRTKYGGRLEWAVTERDKLTLRHDGAVALLPQMPIAGERAGLDPLMMREIQTELSRLRYEMRRGRLQLAGEYAFQALRDPATAAYQRDPVGVSLSERQGLDSFRHSVGLLASYRVHKRVRLLVGQDAMLSVTGSDAQLGTGAVGLAVADTGDWRDRLMTSVGAAVKLSGSLEAQVMESVRWSGDNATALGFKAKFSETASMYVRQILGSQAGRLDTTSVVGAEDRFGEKRGGRTYGEYQLRSGVSGLNNRAILGLSHKWTPWHGISFSGGYEHQQVFGGHLPDGTPTGDSQRDVAHVGFEYIRPRTLKLSTRAELRYDNAAGVAGLGPGTAGQVTAANVDTRAGLGKGYYGDRIVTPGSQLMLTPGERWQVVTRSGVSWAVTRDLTLRGRVNYAYTHNRTTGRVEAEALELGVGAALRPIAWDFLNVLFKYTRLMEMRPISFTDDLSRYRTADVVSLAPMVELPWRLQLVEKVAYKRVAESVDVLPGESLDTVVQTLLWINRLNVHITGKLDAGVEYRLLRLLLDGQGDQLKHGALLELGYWVHQYVRVGAGYNFTRFSDNEFDDQSRDASGFFFRVVGRY